MGKKTHKYYRRLEKSHMKTELVENELQKGYDSSTYLPATSKPWCIQVPFLHSFHKNESYIYLFLNKRLNISPILCLWLLEI